MENKQRSVRDMFEGIAPKDMYILFEGKKHKVICTDYEQDLISIKLGDDSDPQYFIRSENCEVVRPEPAAKIAGVDFTKDLDNLDKL